MIIYFGDREVTGWIVQMNRLSGRCSRYEMRQTLRIPNLKTPRHRRPLIYFHILGRCKNVAYKTKAHSKPTKNLSTQKYIDFFSYTLKTFKWNALKSKHLQTSQINLSTLQKLKSQIFASNIHSRRNNNKWMLTTTKFTLEHLQRSKHQLREIPLHKLKCNQISKHFACTVGL